jgi:hypothetical protein
MDATQTEKLLTKNCFDFLNSILGQFKDPYSTNSSTSLKKPGSSLSIPSTGHPKKEKELRGTYKSVNRYAASAESITETKTVPLVNLKKLLQDTVVTRPPRTTQPGTTTTTTPSKT